MAVTGHWAEPSTTAARPIYADSGLTLVIADGLLTEPGDLPADFVARYQALSPFDEEPGARAAAAYDACNLLFDAIAVAIEREGRPSRAAVAKALAGLTADGVSGQLRADPLDGASWQLMRVP
jgi:ABC-type branched-subunit amino acid transport system substrate-binding protein